MLKEVLDSHVYDVYDNAFSKLQKKTDVDRTAVSEQNLFDDDEYKHCTIDDISQVKEASFLMDSIKSVYVEYTHQGFEKAKLFSLNTFKNILIV